MARHLTLSYFSLALSFSVMTAFSSLISNHNGMLCQTIILAEPWKKNTHTLTYLQYELLNDFT